jgi:hypothetical protein
VPEACAGLTIVIVEIKTTEKQKAMDRSAGRTNLASNAGASIVSPLMFQNASFRLAQDRLVVIVSSVNMSLPHDY